MKLEVGMYVRTKNGIAKIINIFDKEHLMRICGRIQTEKYGLDEEEISKASHNIIDLIEVGDYVNGKLVEDIFEKTNYADKSIKLKGSGDYWYDIHIKSIVTKEQFEQMQYKVGE